MDYKKNDYELIMCIVNNGFSENVMDIARTVGATGGTVIQAKGTANKASEAFFKITIQPEKEMVMILIPKKIKQNVLHALYQSVGLDTPGQGIAFAVPVDDVVGLTPLKPQKEEEKEVINDSEKETQKFSEDGESISKLKTKKISKFSFFHKSK